MASPAAWLDEDNSLRVIALNSNSTNEDQLRSRIEQQSQLIAILKQRADGYLVQTETYKRECEQFQKRTEELERTLQNESKKRDLVERRFEDLARNHEEMIKLKDEHKTNYQKLKLEYEELKRTTIQLQPLASTAAPLELELKRLTLLIDTLEEKHGLKTAECHSLEDRCFKLEAMLTDMERMKEQACEVLRAEIQTLKTALRAGQEQQCQSMEVDSCQQKRISELLCAKEQLEQLSAGQEHKIQDQAKALIALQSKLNDAQKEAASAKEMFCSRSEEVSKDAKVQCLKAELQAVNDRLQLLDKEFQAYKKHSSEMLKQERELNRRLRHFTE